MPGAEHFLLFPPSAAAMDSEDRVSVRRSLIPFAVLASAVAAALSCGDPSPVEVSLPMPVMERAPTANGVVRCSQGHARVTKVIGPAGGLIEVGPHLLWVDTMALTKAVSITALAPSGNMRWVRFQPDGLVFRTNGAGVSAILLTSYKDCGVPPTANLRIAQVTDSRFILRYLDPSVQSAWESWSRAYQYVAAGLDHFSNYAIAW